LVVSDAVCPVGLLLAGPVPLGAEVRHRGLGARRHGPAVVPQVMEQLRSTPVRLREVTAGVLPETLRTPPVKQIARTLAALVG
jgi:hypothetical protein